MVLGIMLFTFANSIKVMAQPKVDDKEIVGVWIMSSMMWEGENKNLISDNYNQVKVYRANGEYACAQIVRNQDGSFNILPHEYGTYTMKDGMYSEMGREAIKYNWVNKTTSRGRWKNRIDEWKKVTDMPESLTQLVVDKCKAAQSDSPEIQTMIKKYIIHNTKKK